MNHFLLFCRRYTGSQTSPAVEQGEDHVTAVLSHTAETSSVEETHCPLLFSLSRTIRHSKVCVKHKPLHFAVFHLKIVTHCTEGTKLVAINVGALSVTSVVSVTGKVFFH